MSIYLRDLSDGGEGYRLPLPSRLSAIVDVLERSDAQDAELLMEAVGDNDTLFWLANAPPDADGTIPMENVEDWVSRYVTQFAPDGTAARRVEAWIDLPEGRGEPRFAVERLRLWSDHPLRIAVELEDGRWLLAESRDPAAREIYGFPPGLFAGVLSGIVAIMSLWALWRGLAPLTRLSKRLADFAENPKPRPLRADGLRETRMIIDAANAMQYRLKTLMDEREALYASISHDLRTYLTRLRLRLSTMDSSDEVARADADLDHMEEIVERGLLEARLNAQRFEPRRFGLRAFLDEIAERWREQVDVCECAAHIWIEADRFLLNRALDNLVDNAIRHGERVAINCEMRYGKAHLHVDDNGEGLANELFGEFTQAFKASEDGSGIGLFLVNRIAEAHGLRFVLGRSPLGGLRASLCGFAISYD